MQKKTKIKIGKIILLTIAAAGVISMAVLAPNTLQLLKIFHGNQKRKYNLKYHINSVITKLNTQGLIKFQKKNGLTLVRLTKKGAQMLLKYQVQEISIKKPKKWDKKWRLIIFDIKEYKRNIRDNLRKELINLGFLRLQNSVWIYPYDCEDVIILLKAHFCIGKEVLYVVAEKIENDKWLKSKFCLT